MNTAGLCKGSTADSDSVCEGSNPSPAASSEIPCHASLPACAESCARQGISSLPTATQSSSALMADEAAASGGASWARRWEEGCVLTDGAVYRTQAVDIDLEPVFTSCPVIYQLLARHTPID